MRSARKHIGTLRRFSRSRAWAELWMPARRFLSITERPMADPIDVDRVWDILDGNSIGMLTTQFSGGLRARPLEARPDRDAGAIFFVTDVHSPKEEEIEARPDVGLVFVDSSNKAYLSITARACIIHDAEMTKTVWRKTDELWWPG